MGGGCEGVKGTCAEDHVDELDVLKEVEDD